MHFSLLWSFFEAEALNTNASANRILKLTYDWANTSRLHNELFTNPLAYFQERYFQNGNFTEYFHALNLRRNDNPDLVASVFNGDNTEPADQVAALLIVVLRLRNNLFHGVKWAYGISGQFENFTYANAILMAALEIHSNF